MILSIIFWIISIASAILIYFCTNLSLHWYLFFIPIILMPFFYLLCFLFYILIITKKEKFIHLYKNKPKRNFRFILLYSIIPGNTDVSSASCFLDKKIVLYLLKIYSKLSENSLSITIFILGSFPFK